jgi:hypothetical protein
MRTLFYCFTKIDFVSATFGRGATKYIEISMAAFMSGQAGLKFTGKFEKLEILEQPDVLGKRGFGKGQVMSVGRRDPQKRFHALLRLEDGRMALEVDVEES